MNELDFLDILTIMSFVLQIQNQSHIIDVGDIQEEIGKAVNNVHAHLTIQDEKINKILIILEDKDENN